MSVSSVAEYFPDAQGSYIFSVLADPIGLIVIWLILTGLVLFLLMGIDKSRAKNGKWRISEKTLLLLSVFGGFIGGFFGMYLFRHKTKKPYFHAVFILSAIAYLALICILYFK